MKQINYRMKYEEIPFYSRKKKMDYSHSIEYIYHPILVSFYILCRKVVSNTLRSLGYRKKYKRNYDVIVYSLIGR